MYVYTLYRNWAYSIYNYLDLSGCLTAGFLYSNLSAFPIIIMQKSASSRWHSQDFGKGRAQIGSAEPEQALNNMNFYLKKKSSLFLSISMHISIESSNYACRIDWQIQLFKLSWSWWSTKGGGSSSVSPPLPTQLALAPSAPLCLHNWL